MNDYGKAITSQGDPLNEFREKLKTKIREDIALMLPDEVVEQMVRQTVEEEFFKPNRINKGTEYNPRWEEAPSWFMEVVAKEAKPILEQAVKDFVEENRPVIDKALSAYLTSETLTLLAIKGIANEMSSEINSLTRTISEIASRSGRYA